MTESFELDQLLKIYAAGNCTEEEFNRLMLLAAKMDAGDIPGDHWKQSWESIETPSEMSADWKNRLSSMLEEYREEETSGVIPAPAKKIRSRNWLVAAAVAFFLVSGYLVRLVITREDRGVGSIPVAREHYHGHERATLILADGREIGLDTASLGRVAIQSGVKISKSEEGELFYYPEPEAGVSQGFNTITVPRSGNYSVVLSDGSKVHLNAASTLRFPVLFSGQSRDVSLTGEGYFEVAKNPARPFHVTTTGFTVEVFGTHFNVRSYADDGSSSATLVEGKVRIRKEGSGRNAGIFLKPKQQADLNSSGRLTLNTRPNLEEVLAWQTNTFKFANRPVSSILRDVSRWYDVPIVYHGIPPEQQLTGTFSRTTELPQVVAMLRYAGVKVTIAPDRSLIVGQ